MAFISCFYSCPWGWEFLYLQFLQRTAYRLCVVCGSSWNPVSPWKLPASHGACLWLPLCDVQDLWWVSHLGYQLHRMWATARHVEAGSDHCNSHARTRQAPSHACVRTCVGMSPAKALSGFQAEVPIAGIADQNLHNQLSHRRLIIIVCNLSCAKCYRYIGQAAWKSSTGG